MIWLWLSAICMVVTALTHSILGERRLIGPLLAIDDPLLRRPLARKLLRFAWHFISLFMLLSAAVVVWPAVPPIILILTGALWLFAGLFDGVYTKGEHIGWPMLTMAGVLALIGAMGGS